MRQYRNRSWVWKFYYQPNPETPRVGVCKACNRIYSNGSVERMQKHLKNCEKLPMEDRIAIEAYTFASPPPPTLPKRRKRKPAPTVAQPCSSASYIPVSDKEANKDLVQMILTGQFPLSMIQNEHFIRFLFRLNPDYELPNRNFLLLNCLLDPATRGNKLTALERNEALRLIRQQLAIDPRFGHTITTEAREWLSFKGDYAVDTEGPRSEAWEELKQADGMNMQTWWSVFFPDKKLGQLVSLLQDNLIIFKDSEGTAEPVVTTNHNDDDAASNESSEQQRVMLNVPQSLQGTYQNSINNGYFDVVSE